MQRLRRYLVRAASVACVAMLGVTLFTWGVSQFYVLRFARIAEDEHGIKRQIDMFSARGGLLRWKDEVFAPPPDPSPRVEVFYNAYADRRNGFRARGAWDYAPERSPWGGSVLGVLYLSGPLNSPANGVYLRWHTLEVPCSIITVVLGIPFAFILRARSRRRLISRRRRSGLCAACGYDLRASSGRCPECGAASSIDLPSAL